MKKLNIKNQIFFELDEYEKFKENIENKNISENRNQQLEKVSERFKKAIDKYGEVKISLDQRDGR